MRRNPDLIRKILLALEANDRADTDKVELSGDRAERLSVPHHLEIMTEGGLLTHGFRHELHHGRDDYKIASSLTAYGHELLDLIRDDSRWNSAKEQCRSARLSPDWTWLVMICEHKAKQAATAGL